MNAKKVKSLCKEARFRLDWPTTYEDIISKSITVEKLKEDKVGKIILDSSGNPCFEEHLIHKYTKRMPNCTRKVYKQLKKESK